MSQDTVTISRATAVQARRALFYKFNSLQSKDIQGLSYDELKAALKEIKSALEKA